MCNDLQHPVAMLYVIKECDTVKTRDWFDKQQVHYRFHDYCGDGLEANLLQHFIDRLVWKPLLNIHGITWRQLSAAQCAEADNARSSGR